MTANVSIETQNSHNTLRLPIAALRFTPTEELLNTISIDREILSRRKSLHEATVWVARDGKLDRFVEVVTGISDNSWTQLVKGNVSEGEKLIINAQVVK